mmetsp:Transcript_101900/g.292398  ORF Transcript_101900/g.292398 Transcript_101900/m.292398 type:complete len:229 (+) Transcript_101900:83-769(+)
MVGPGWRARRTECLARTSRRVGWLSSRTGSTRRTSSSRTPTSWLRTSAPPSVRSWGAALSASPCMASRTAMGSTASYPPTLCAGTSHHCWRSRRTSAKAGSRTRSWRPSRRRTRFSSRQASRCGHLELVCSRPRSVPRTLSWPIAATAAASWRTGMRRRTSPTTTMSRTRSRRRFSGSWILAGPSRPTTASPCLGPRAGLQRRGLWEIIGRSLRARSRGTLSRAFPRS